MIGDYDILQYGDSSLLIQFEHVVSEEIHLKVKHAFRVVRTLAKDGVVSVIPAYNSLTVIYNGFQIGFHDLAMLLRTELDKKELQDVTEKFVYEIPVFYAESLGLDIQEVSALTNLSIPEIIRIHSSTKYLIYFYGFVPGFMYLGGLDPRLTVRRRENPRISIPKGSVALADQQTAVYPLETPGGWQIIGRTPVDFELFCGSSAPEMGDYLSFRSIGVDEYNELLEKKDFIPQKTKL